MRILEKDAGALRLLADIEGRSLAQVFHSALTAYFEHHRDEIAAIFEEAQAAVAAGDLEGLTRQFTRSADSQAEELAAQRMDLR